MERALLLCGMFSIVAAVSKQWQWPLAVEGTDVQVQQASSSVPILAPGLEWVSATSAAGGGLVVPEGAFVGGYQYHGDPLYIVRVLAPDGKYHPAKSWDGRFCRYSYNDDEWYTTTPGTCDFLVVRGDDKIIEFIPASGGDIPVHAVQVGEYYICRHAVWKVGVVIGELDPEEGICTVPSCGEVWKYPEYEVLRAIIPTTDVQVQQASSSVPPRLEWVSATSATGGGLVVPEGAFVGGHEIDGDPLYIVRVLAPDGKYHPGKSWNGRHCRYAYINGEESYTNTPGMCDFLVVRGDDEIIEFIPASGGDIPVHAVQVEERNGYYICRHGMWKGGLIVGELDPEEGICAVTSCGQVWKYPEYEVLRAIIPNTA